MHDQSANRVSGLTRAAISVMCVRVLRIADPEECGQFTRDECRDLSAEKAQRVKHFVHRERNLSRAGNFRTPVRLAGF
jgi:hypothetical protein